MNTRELREVVSLPANHDLSSYVSRAGRSCRNMREVDKHAQKAGKGRGQEVSVHRLNMVNFKLFNL